MKFDFLLKQGLEKTETAPLNYFDQVDGQLEVVECSPAFNIHSRVVGIDHKDQIVQENLISSASGS